MRQFGDVEAIKIRLGQLPEVPPKVRFTPIDDPWLVAIIRHGQILASFVGDASRSAIRNYREQIRVDHEADGRVISIEHPVGLNGGIRDAIELLENVDPILDQFEREFEFLKTKARFDGDDRYQEVAKATLNFEETAQLEQRQQALAHQQRQIIRFQKVAVGTGISWAVLTVVTGETGPLWTALGMLIIVLLAASTYIWRYIPTFE